MRTGYGLVNRLCDDTTALSPDTPVRAGVPFQADDCRPALCRRAGNAMSAMLARTILVRASRRIDAAYRYAGGDDGVL